MANNTGILLRNDTASNWTTDNPTLAQGEMGIETDTKKIKVGDGTTAWTSLDYFNVGVAGYTLREFWYGELSSNQTSNLAVNNHVELDNVAVSAPSTDISLSTGTGQAKGIITLPKGSYYVLFIKYRAAYSSTSGGVNMAFYNRTDSSQIAGTLGSAPLNSSSNKSLDPGQISVLDLTSATADVDIDMRYIYVSYLTSISGNTPSGSSNTAVGILRFE